MTVELVYLAVAALLAPAFAEIAKLRAKADKAFACMAAGGVLFLLAAAFSVVDLNVYVAGLSTTVTTVAGVLGLICVLAGAVMALIALLKE
jgi:uncharacterized membrane-anchored protein